MSKCESPLICKMSAHLKKIYINRSIKKIALTNKVNEKASLFFWLIHVIAWSRVLCSEVYLVGSENSHLC